MVLTYLKIDQELCIWALLKEPTIHVCREERAKIRENVPWVKLCIQSHVFTLTPITILLRLVRFVLVQTVFNGR